MNFKNGAWALESYEFQYKLHRLVVRVWESYLLLVFSSVKLNVNIDKIADFLWRLNEIMCVKILILINFEAIMKLN